MIKSVDFGNNFTELSNFNFNENIYNPYIWHCRINLRNKNSMIFSED